MSYDWPMLKATAIYARISSDREGDHLGVGRQLEDCRDAAARRGWKVVEEYVDNDVSAYKSKVRPEYRRMLSDIKDGYVDSVVVYDQDRLTRQPRDLEEFFDICDAAGVRDLATVSGVLDLSTDSGQFTARILGAVARKSSDDQARRIQRKHAELAADGKISGGGPRPYGYEPDKLKVRESEAVVVREIAGRILAGDSVRSICANLDQRGIRTSSGKTWNPSVLRKMMMSGRISAQREHHGEIVGPAEWEPIIPPADTARLRAALGADGRSTSARHPRRYLLAGLLRCQYCGESLVSRPRAGGVRQYVCAKGPGLSGCGRISVLAEPVESLIFNSVIDLLDTPRLAEGIARGVVDDQVAAALHSDLDADQAQLVELATAYGNKDLSLAEMLAAKKPIEERITKARKKLSRLTRTTVLDGYLGHGAELKAEWSELNLTRQAAIVKALLDHAVIAPAVRGRNIFDRERVTAVWKR